MMLLLTPALVIVNQYFDTCWRRIFFLNYIFYPHLPHRQTHDAAPQWRGFNFVTFTLSTPEVVEDTQQGNFALCSPSFVLHHLLPS